jgi:murein DD-endopeptidase MepM/ murein hydrolase activator NlpD
MKKHPMYLTAVLVAFLGLLLLPMAGQKTQTEKAEVKTKSVKPQVEILNLSLNPLPVLDVAVMQLTLDPTPIEDIPHIQKTRKALTVKNDIRLKLKKELRAKVNLNLRVRIPPFINPVPGAEISSGFGKRLHPKTKELMHHNGVDLAARTGTPVLAAGDGMVIKANGESPDEVYGFYVIIAHADGYETLYSSLDKILITEGDEIRGGDVIGHVGETGQATGPHLHFELRKDGTPVNPANYIKFQK